MWVLETHTPSKKSRTREILWPLKSHNQKSIFKKSLKSDRDVSRARALAAQAWRPEFKSLGLMWKAGHSHVHTCNPDTKGDRQENYQGLLTAGLVLGSWRDSVSRELRENNTKTSNIFLWLSHKCAWTYTQAYSHTTRTIQHVRGWRRKKKNLMRM